MCCEPAARPSSRYSIVRALWRTVAVTGLLWLALSVDARAAEHPTRSGGGTGQWADARTATAPALVPCLSAIGCP